MSDGLVRCGWASSTPDYLSYHDLEWGTVLHGDDALFERLSLEAFQSGLSWITILRKRPAFREVFAEFQISMVAQFDACDVNRLLGDVRIVRNRAKIEATISNAQCIAETVPEGLDTLLWSFAPVSHRVPVGASEVNSISAESIAMSKELKKRGFRFVGPTTAYALMQAAGMVNDHVATCFRSASSE